MSTLSKFRRMAVQLLRAGKSIAANPDLAKDEVVDALYGALDEIAGIIDALSYPSPLNGKKPELWTEWNRRMEEKRRKGDLLDDFEQNRNPFIFAGRFYGNGCPIAVIGHFDPQLRTSLYRWEARHGNDTEFTFPNERNEHDRILTIISTNPDFKSLPASKLLQARAVLTLGGFLRARKSNQAKAKRSPG